MTCFLLEIRVCVSMLCVQLELGSQIFDGVASLIYDCLDIRRQYQQYRNNVKFISVPAVVKHSEPVEVNICRYS